jgi:hypothetical protein
LERGWFMKTISLLMPWCVILIIWYAFLETTKSQREYFEKKIQESQKEQIVKMESIFKEQERKTDKHIIERMRLEEESYQEEIKEINNSYTQLIKYFQESHNVQKDQQDQVIEVDNNKQLDKKMIHMEQYNHMKSDNYIKTIQEQKEKHEHLMEQARKEREAEKERQFKEDEAEKDRQSKERIEKEKAKSNRPVIIVTPYRY